jgi:cell division protein FtsQ
MSRNRRHSLPRRVVRRTRPAVGMSPERRIVRRHSGVVAGRRRRGFSVPRPHLSLRRLVPGRRVKWATFILTPVLALGAAGAWAWQTPTLRISTVTVDGNERIASDTIVDRAGLLGARIYTADIAAATSRLYEHPLVSSVEVQRDWPDRVRIVIHERQAWGVWEQAGVRYTIDRDGIVLGTTPPAAGSPVILSAEPGALQQGSRVNYQAVEAAAEIYERLPRQLGTTVAEISYLGGRGVQVRTATGEIALFGDSSSISYKLAVWAAVAAQSRAQGISYTTIDLRFGSRPVVQ